jgi:AcrR family transcriptional regulator
VIPPGVRAPEGAGERSAIVAAIFDVVAVRGFRASALAEIAARVGITPGRILYHFGSTEALLLAVVAERDRRAGALLAAVPPGDGLDRLRALVRIAEMCEAQPGLAAVHTGLQLESLQPGTAAHEYFAARSRSLRAAVADVLARAQEAGVVAPRVDCPGMACELLAFLEGASVLWLTDRSVSLVELYAGYVESFIARVTGR